MAAQHYCTIMSNEHVNLHVEPCGLVINPKYPYLGSSPDRIVMCDCHGNGVLEIKCPFKFKGHLRCTINDSAFCLTTHDKSDGVMCSNSLRRNHRYYAQVQGQLLICEVSYCDFVVFTEEGLHIERIFRDETFCNRMLSGLEKFFKHCILPEILTHRLQQSCTGKDQNYCICGKRKIGKTVICSGQGCSGKWFHAKCMGFQSVPKGKWTWTCRTCRENSE